MIDQTDRLKIGVKWIAKMTEPYPLADQIDEYPVADPRANTELLQVKKLKNFKTFLRNLYIIYITVKIIIQ